ncbi:prepilin-type N-terminal cleavage/methylation domain-containing protein [Candidatus Daviesbacteria bacterium]|nr:prepilin-type N-terminal cleavage/methylation domain-containing protein [Candidatus Daviesbacteria bacterium]
MQQGFTLIEILFVILILAFAVIIMVPNLRQFSQDQELSSYADNLKQALRIAQSGAVSGIKCATLPTSGWQVSLKSGQFNTVAVCNDPTGQTAPGAETKSTTTFLPSTEVTISEDKCGILTGTDQDDVIFTGSQVNFLCRGAPYTGLFPFWVELKNAKNNKTQKVYIDRGGLIY